VEHNVKQEKESTEKVVITERQIKAKQEELAGVQVP
jgi:hypothetical protein